MSQITFFYQQDSDPLSSFILLPNVRHLSAKHSSDLFFIATFLSIIANMLLLDHHFSHWHVANFLLFVSSTAVMFSFLQFIEPRSVLFQLPYETNYHTPFTLKQSSVEYFEYNPHNLLDSLEISSLVALARLLEITC